jgi:hypothetical protein
VSKSKKSKAPATVTDTTDARATVLAGITNLATLGAALAAFTRAASVMLGTVAWGGMYRTVSGGHVNKRGLFVASLIDTIAGDGTLASLATAQARYAVDALRAEVAYALATGDVAYFKTRKGEWCGWATPIMLAGALNPDATDAQYAAAFERTCPTNPANVGGMLAEVTLQATRRNVTPVPVFADTVKYGTVALFDAETHGADGYQSKAYGSATFTLTA